METGDRIMLAWDHWHIELSSICALKCPRCPRAEVPDSLLNRQLTLEFFKTQLGYETAQHIKKITFCGNDGDPIYCKDIVDICVWLKTANPKISIVVITNGSYRTGDWWQYLGKVLGKNDEIHWSIDGWDQASNEQYRVNSNWNSIIAGIENFKSVNNETYCVWASIAFRFNEDHLNQQKQLARDLKFDLYQLTKSTKFGSKYPLTYSNKDLLEPVNSDLVASGHRFERTLDPLSDKQRPGLELKKIFLQRAADLDKHTTHSGICLIGNKGVFLNSQGEFYPCCWTANRYKHNEYWHTQAQTNFNLHKKTFKEIIKDEFWTTDFLKFDSQECQTKCTRDRLTDIEHTTEW